MYGSIRYISNMDAKKPGDFEIDIAFHPKSQPVVTNSVNKAGIPPALAAVIRNDVLPSSEVKSFELKTSYVDLLNRKSPDFKIRIECRFAGVKYLIKASSKSFSASGLTIDYISLFISQPIKCIMPGETSIRIFMICV